MKLVILYHPKSDHARTVEDYAHDFSRQMNHDIQLVSLESIEGANLARLYDIVRYPALMVISPSNELMKVWEGPVMPLTNEVSFYTQQH